MGERRTIVMAIFVVATTLVGCAAQAPQSPAPSATPQPTTTTAQPNPSVGSSAVAAPTSAPTSNATPAVSTTDVTINGGAKPSVAYLVAPESAAANSAAGIVWFHWLNTGDPSSNRTEFLAEAQALAAKGVVSVLVDGQFPWHEDPTSQTHDIAALQSDVAMLNGALDVLKQQPAVDPARIALVGHDFGAMYSAVLFGQDPSIVGLAMMTPTARWSDWFQAYWTISGDPVAYRNAMKPFDPVTVLGNAAGRSVLLQFGKVDQFVPSSAAAEITTAAGSGVERKDYSAGHQLDATALADRDAWLAQILKLGP